MSDNQIEVTHKVEVRRKGRDELAWKDVSWNGGTLERAREIKSKPYQDYEYRIVKITREVVE